MFNLDEKTWLTLGDDLGRTRTLLLYLEQLQNDSCPLDSAWWADFGDILINDGKITSTTFAAVPLLVNWAKQQKAEDQIKPMMFVGMIELNRHRKQAVTMNASLAQNYFDALQDTKSLIVGCLAYRWSQEDFRVFLFVLSVLGGELAIAYQIAECPIIQCPKCSTIVDPNREFYALFNQR